MPKHHCRKMWNSSLQESQVKKVNVVVIGCGHLGKWHVQKVCEINSAQLVGIVESCHKGKARVQKLYPDKYITTNLDDIINDIDAAIVATPTQSHFEIMKVLLNFKKHVFCEKPLTSTLSEAMKIRELARKQKLVVQVGHSERFHRSWEERINFPEFFKEPGTVRISRLAPYKGRGTDVDVVQDLMIHDLDLICYLFGEIPFKVHSVGHKIRTDKWDYVTSKFHFNSGRVAFITVARNHIKEVRDFEVTNKNGCFYVDLLNSEFHVARADATQEHGFVKIDKYPSRDHLLEEQRCFYDSILYQKPVVIGVEDGVLAVRLVERVLEGLERDCEINI